MKKKIVMAIAVLGMAFAGQDLQAKKWVKVHTETDPNNSNCTMTTSICSRGFGFAFCEEGAIQVIYSAGCQGMN